MFSNQRTTLIFIIINVIFTRGGRFRISFVYSVHSMLQYLDCHFRFWESVLIGRCGGGGGGKRLIVRQEALIGSRVLNLIITYFQICFRGSHFSACMGQSNI